MKQIFTEVFYFTKCNLDPIIRIIGPFILLMLCVGIPVNYYSEDIGSAAWGYWIVMMLVQPYYMCLLIKYMNNAVDNETENMRVSFVEWFNLFVVYILYTTAVIIGFIALIIPGIYLAARYGFAEFESVLNKRKPIQALKSSWELTSSKVPVLMWGSIVIVGASILIDIPLSYLGELNTGVMALTEIISELVSMLSMVLMSVFFFRVYGLTNNLTNA